MSGVDWGAFVRASENSSRAMAEAGEKIGRAIHERSMSRAIMDLRADPTNEKALRFLYSQPGGAALVAGLEDRAREDAFRNSTADLLLNGDGGGAPMPPQQGGGLVPQQRSVPTFQGPSRQSPLNALAAPQTGDLGSGPQPGSSPALNALSGGLPAPSGSISGLPSMAAPAPVRSPAYERAVRANPEGFLTFQGKRTELTKKRLEVSRDLNDYGMQILSGVHDQPSFDAARQRVAQIWQQHGGNPAELDNLPTAYSPEVVRDLQLQGMDTAKQLQAIARENRLEWDIADDEADNERADENLESQIGYRNERARLTRRGQDLTDKRARNRPAGRGTAPKAPSPTSVIGRIMDKQARGETLTAAERQTYDEYRAGRGRGGGKSKGAERGAPVRVKSIGEARKLAPGTVFITPDGKVKVR